MDGAAIDTQYEDLLRRVLTTGVAEGGPHRDGHGEQFGERLRYDLSEGFPW